MAKDSNKLAVLARRKIELDHAINNELAPTAIARRVEKLRSAALAVAKKYRGSWAHLKGCSGNKEWIELKDQWENFTIEEIIKIVRQWPSRPTVSHVRFQK